MKIQSVTANNRRRAFELSTPKGDFAMPYARVEVVPTSEDPIAELYIDDELGREAFTYVLRSGAEGTVHVDDVLEHNREPEYMRDLMLHCLTVEAIHAVESSGLSKREIMRRAGTSPAQFYRLLDPANYSKSIDGLLKLLAAVDCEVDFTVRPYVAEERPSS